jgi:hypothetical protein
MYALMISCAAALLLLSCQVAHAQGGPQKAAWDTYSDTWVGEDALGMPIPANNAQWGRSAKRPVQRSRDFDPGKVSQAGGR